jgi:hypothetical protein
MTPGAGAIAEVSHVKHRSIFCQTKGCGTRIRAGRTYCPRCALQHRMRAAIKAARTRQRQRAAK